MADTEKNQATTEKVTSNNKTKMKPSTWVPWVVLGAVVLAGLLAVGALLAGRVLLNRYSALTSPRVGTHLMVSHPRFGGDSTFSVSQSSSDGLTTTTTNTTYTQTQGVVTQVNSDNIVVAGGGKTQKITTNSSTTYVGDTKPAVNDTVVVVGTKSGDTITATQIEVFNS
jgi:hypothetical protein